MSEYTKGRITQHLVDETALKDESGAHFATTFISELDYQQDGVRRGADAARIAACWNAMTGIEDPAAFMEEVREVLGPFAEAIRWMSDELGDDYRPDWSPFISYGAYRRARALLEKMEGK